MGIKGFRNQDIYGIKDLGFRDQWIKGLRGLRGFRDSGIQGFGNWDTYGYRDY